MKMHIDLSKAFYKKSEIVRARSINECGFLLPELKDYTGYVGTDLMRYLAMSLKSPDSYVWIVKRGDKVIGCLMMIITGDVARISCVRINHYDLERLVKTAVDQAKALNCVDVLLQTRPSRKVEKLGFKLHRMLYKINLNGG